MTSRKKQYGDLFNNLNNFMLTNDNIIRYISINKTIKTNNKLLNKKQEKTKETSNIFVPKQRDMLFWCFYIILNSKEQYLFNINNTFTNEKQTKINAIEILKTKKSKLKEHKLKINEVENELLNENKITLTGLAGLCIAYNISICVVKDRIVFDFHYSENLNGIICWSTNNYGVYDDDYNTFFSKIESTHYMVTNPCKPIKAISGYTVKDLCEICKKLDISIIDTNGGKLKKQDLYQKIVNIM